MLTPCRNSADEAQPSSERGATDGTTCPDVSGDFKDADLASLSSQARFTDVPNCPAGIPINRNRIGIGIVVR